MSIFLFYYNFALLGPFRDMMEGAFMRRVSGVVLGGYAGDAWGGDAGGVGECKESSGRVCISGIFVISLQ